MAEFTEEARAELIARLRPIIREAVVEAPTHDPTGLSDAQEQHVAWAVVTKGLGDLLTDARAAAHYAIHEQDAESAEASTEAAHRVLDATGGR